MLKASNCNMAKYNKYNIGDKVYHLETPLLEFQINEVLIGQPEVPGNYLYECILITDHHEQAGQTFNYHENQISKVKYDISFS